MDIFICRLLFLNENKARTPNSNVKQLIINKSSEVLSLNSPEGPTPATSDNRVLVLSCIHSAKSKKKTATEHEIATIKNRL
jgi:hypothetical protein